MAATEPNVPYHLKHLPSDYPLKPGKARKPKYGWRDDNGRPIRDINENGDPICGRKLNNQDKVCQRTILCANGRCSAPSHGGKNPGAAIKHGGYSQFLPTRLAADYQEIMKDDVLRTVREHMAVVSAMIREKVSALGDRTGGQLWKQAGRAIEKLREAYSKSDHVATLEQIDSLAAMLREGGSIQAKEAEISALMRSCTDLANTEMKRLEKMRKYMTAEQAMAFQAAVVAILKKHVEPKILSRVSAEFGAMCPSGLRDGTMWEPRSGGGEL